jgi:double-strand break repair protein MRE11
MIYLFPLFVQGKLAKDSDAKKFEEDDLILKVGECLEARRYRFS